MVSIRGLTDIIEAFSYTIIWHNTSHETLNEWTGLARGFGYKVSRVFFTKVFGILCQNFQV